MPRCRIALAQINTTVGAIRRNSLQILETLQKAARYQADLVIFPELAITGYPPLDLLDRPSFITHNLEAIERIAAATSDLPAALVGFVQRENSETGKGLFNSAALCAEGKIQAVQSKTLLPTYDVFDETRYFDSAPSRTVLSFKGLRLGVSICEDIWNDALYWKMRDQRRRYPVDPVEELAGQGMDLLINMAASPYTEGKRAMKEGMLAAAAKRHQCPLIHVNLVGGNDSLIFDGWSNVFNKEGAIVAQCADFQEDLLVLDLDTESGTVTETGAGLNHNVQPEEIGAMADALTLGIRDYLGKTGFQKAIIGLSGGIDSAVTAALAVRALNPEHVLGVAMPSEYSSDHSRSDAMELAENLGIRFHEIAIQEVYGSFLKTLGPYFEGTPFGLAEENLQARARGALLMALANKFGAIVLSTGNKSEMAVGYCTLYGDMNGGLAVLSDVPKTKVYDLARWLNRKQELIPENTIQKPPSAELRPDQKDSDSLPPYETLDPIIRLHVEEGFYVDEIVAEGFERETVERVLQLIERNEYKRRQAAIGLKVTHRAFGYGRRMPVARAADFAE